MAHVLASELRKAVLQAAFEGKLTTHEQNDSNPFELLAEIKSIKSELVNKKTIKKEKELGMEECPYDFPEYWAVSNLQNICSLIGDIDHNMPKAVSPENGVMFLSAKDLLNDGTINYTNNIKYISREDFDRLSRKAKPQLGDIIYSRIGAALGKARVVDKNIEFLVSYSCCIIRPINMNINFLRYYLESPGIYKHANDAKQSIGVPDVGMADIKRFSVVIPPIEEQARIVARVDELMAKIDEYEKLENELVELKKNFPGDMKAAVLQAAMQGRLTEQLKSDSDVISKYKKNIVNDDNIIIPDNWAALKLKDVATHQNGKAFKPTNWSQKGMKIIRIQNLTDPDAPANYCDPSIVEEKYVISNGDVLVSWSCTIDAYRYLGETAALNQHIFKVIFDKADVDSQFYIYAIKSLLTIIDSQRHGSTMTHITKTDYENLSFPLPPIEEQKRIVEKLDKILPLCEKLEKEIA